MSNVTVHHPKEEWERDTDIETRVSFLIGWNSILVDDLLERCSKRIEFEESRWFQLICRNLFYL